MDLSNWQGHKGSNSGHAVLETAALPTELYPYEKLYPFTEVQLARRKGFEPPTFWFVAKHSIQLS